MWQDKRSTDALNMCKRKMQKMDTCIIYTLQPAVHLASQTATEQNMCHFG